MWVYHLLDVFFFVFHSALIVFIVIGWVSRRTRVAHLIVIMLTGLSWFGLGLWYGIGYCPCTDWHWMVRERLGYEQETVSYLKFVFDALTGISAPVLVVNYVAFTVFSVVTGISVGLNAARLMDKNA